MSVHPNNAGITDVKPLLTLAIPTYNRSHFLGELLSVLFDQLAAEPRVELIVSDNASPDKTPELVHEYQQRGLQLRYIRNESNLGPDGNILQCFEQARGKYVWIFGDDDVLAPGGLAWILSHLEGKEYDLVYVSPYAIDGQTRDDPARVDGTPRASYSAPIEITDARLFARRVNVFFTFITGNIINKDRVLASKPAPFSTLVGTNLVQLGWTYTALNGYTRGLFIQEKLIGARVNNTGGYKLLKVFGPTLQAVTAQWLQADALRRLVINGALRTFWPGMLLQYRKSAAEFEKEANPARVLTPVFKDNLRYWIFAYPILVLPSALAVWWLFAVRIYNRADRAVVSLRVK